MSLVAKAAAASPDSTKHKRKAPAPPPRPSVPTPHSSRKSDSEITPPSHNLSAVSTPSVSPSSGQKKRKAPPRPTSLLVKPRIPPPFSNVPEVQVVVRNGEVNTVKDWETDDIGPVDKNAPPVFIAPPPPDDLPPPLDECATPVCPVDEDDFDRSFLTGIKLEINMSKHLLYYFIKVARNLFKSVQYKLRVHRLVLFVFSYYFFFYFASYYKVSI